MFCRIYLGGRIPNRQELLFSISNLLQAELIENKYIEADYYSIEIRSNDDYDEVKQRVFPDGFLYFPFSIEIDFQEDADAQFASEVTGNILNYLWRNKNTAIASCEFEEQLPERGGYKSETIPWFE